MGKNKTKTYGKGVRKHQGYTIRILFKDGKNPSGKFGIFAGKKMIQDAPNVEAAVKQIDQLVLA